MYNPEKEQLHFTVLLRFITHEEHFTSEFDP